MAMGTCTQCGNQRDLIYQKTCAACIVNGYRNPPCYACDRQGRHNHGGRLCCDHHLHENSEAYAPSTAIYQKVWEHVKVAGDNYSNRWFWSAMVAPENWPCGHCGVSFGWSRGPHCPNCGIMALWCDTCETLKSQRTVASEDGELVNRTQHAADGTLFHTGKVVKQTCEECMKKAGKHFCTKCRKITTNKVMVAHHDLTDAEITAQRKRGTNWFTEHQGHYKLEEQYMCPTCVPPRCRSEEFHAGEHYGTLGAIFTGAVPGKKMSACFACCGQMRDIYQCVHCRALWRGKDKDGYCPTCMESMKPCGACGKIADLRGLEFCKRCMTVGAHNARAEEVYAFESPKCHENCPGTNKHVDTCTFDGIYLGVELEVECGNKDRGLLAAAVRKQLQHKFLVKHDGSLANGLEIVSPPAYMGWHMENWKPMFDWNDKAKSLRSHDTGTCGMHVHLSRKTLTKQHIKNCVTFLHDPKNHDFVAMVAGRPSGHYHDFSAPKGKWNDTYTVEADNINRYTALNLTNAHTIEYRMFRGSMKWETFAARLEFARALTLFAKRPEDELTKEHFLAWVEAQPEYPNLQQYLAKGSLIKERK